MQGRGSISHVEANGCGSQNRFGIPFWLVGAPPILEPISGDWDVHCGYDLDFDPWPNGSSTFRFDEDTRKHPNSLRQLHLHGGRNEDFASLILP